MTQSNQKKPVQKSTANPVPKQPVKEKQAVEQGKYDRYTSLKFLELSGVKLKDANKNELLDLETEIKKCSGKVPNKTVRAAINNEIALLVEGVPVPKSIENLIKNKGVSSYYFE